MNKKKVIAIVLFLFMSLFMFTFANPANKISEKQDDKKTEETDKTINSDKNKNQLEIIDDAPTIYVDPYAIEIVEGSSYNVFKGVTIRDDHDTNLKATASIIDTTKLVFGKTYTVYYTTKDSSNNTSTATRLITVLDPNGDKDKDGFTNKEEVDKNTDFSDEKDYPETLAPVLTLKGDNPTIIELNVDSYKEEGVEV